MPRAKTFMAACGANLILLDRHNMGMLQSYENKLKTSKNRNMKTLVLFCGVIAVPELKMNYI